MSTESAHLVEVAGTLRAALARFDPSSIPGAECGALAEALASTEKACAAARLLTAARAVACGAHREAGVPDPARWVARQAGSTTRQAKDALSVAASLESCRATKDALLAGEVSISQAAEITKAASEVPGAEAELLAVAVAGDLSQVRDGARERVMSSIPVGDLHKRQLAARRFRHWRDGLGMVCFEGALSPEKGIPFVNRIEREAARRHRQSKQEGAPERFEAYAADALLALTMTGGSGKREPNVDLVLVCDLHAWRRGHRHEGEPCHVVGGGPIPVEIAKEFAADAFLKVVLHDGKDIQKVWHAGRRYTAELKTALDLGPVPAFPGRACADCGTRGYGLYYDHKDPVAHTGPTTITNVQTLCHPCHADKTERDRRAGLLGRKAKARGPGPPARSARGSGPYGASPRAPAARRAPPESPAH